MPEHQSAKNESAPWRFPVALDDVAEDGAHFDLIADAEIRAAVARIAGLRELPRLRADFEVKRLGDDALQVTGRISATVEQACVVTLEPVANEVEEEVALLFAPPKAAAAPPAARERDGDEFVAPGADEVELLVGGQVDLGAIATEFLILGLDPYPRKPGAVFEPPPEAEPETGPFAALAALKKDRDDH
jgi:uncharacterized metal-binding protein YceD (DUF177 family)